MDFKQAIIDNAWGGINMDYGLLHLQLATPVAVLIVLLIMIVTLNKLLFQPVLRTLDNRKKVIEKSPVWVRFGSFLDAVKCSIFRSSATENVNILFE